MDLVDVSELMTPAEAAERLGCTPEQVEEMVWLGLIDGAVGFEDPENPVIYSDAPVMVFRKDLDALDAETRAATGLTMKQLVANAVSAARLAADASGSVQ